MISACECAVAEPFVDSDDPNCLLLFGLFNFHSEKAIVDPTPGVVMLNPGKALLRLLIAVLKFSSQNAYGIPFSSYDSTIFIRYVRFTFTLLMSC